MTVAALCASHTPLKDYRSPGAAVEREIAACFRDVRAWVRDYDPELVVVIGPDHFNGFFYRCLPSFCVGAVAESVGDWATPAGPFPVAGEVAEACTRSLHDSGIDAAISYRMTVDHGVTQIIDQLFDWHALPPLVPVFINCAAPPLPPLQRVAAFGEALGAFAQSLDRRVLVIGSGGLSHDPPMPVLADAPPSVRERLIAGGELSIEARAARQERVLADADLQAAGKSARTRLNPDWDRAFLDRLEAKDYDAIVAMDDASITRDGGCGGHEIRSWIAATCAAHAAGECTPQTRYYHTIHEWIAGYGVFTLTPTQKKGPQSMRAGNVG